MTPETLPIIRSVVLLVALVRVIVLSFTTVGLAQGIWAG